MKQESTCPTPEKANGVQIGDEQTKFYYKVFPTEELRLSSGLGKASICKQGRHSISMISDLKIDDFGVTL